jgi:putative CocE/NonD family hydrolase
MWSRADGDRLGNVPFDAKTSLYYREHFELPFLKHFLKGDDKEQKLNLAEANVFETGTNQWRHFDVWPPKNVAEKALYLHAGGLLSFDPPTDSGGNSFDEYVSDPAKPVPYTASTAVDRTAEYMDDDQRFAATRTDVLVYQTDVLKDDVTLAGPLSARLHVSTSGTDSDFVVKLIDVYSNDFPNPDPNPAKVQMAGYQQLVRGDVMRGKFRNSYEKPEPFTPDQATAVNWTMPDVFHTFRRGHRIMIQIQSSWFPLVDRNPQTFCNVNTATEGDFHKATERIYHSAQAASQLRVGILVNDDKQSN